MPYELAAHDPLVIGARTECVTHPTVLTGQPHSALDRADKSCLLLLSQDPHRPRGDDKVECVNEGRIIENVKRAGDDNLVTGWLEHALVPLGKGERLVPLPTAAEDQCTRHQFSPAPRGEESGCLRLA